MSDPLTEQLISRQVQDPQAAWQKASSIGADPIAEAIHNPNNWLRGEMPLVSGAVPGMQWLLKLLKIAPSTPIASPPSNFATLGEKLPEFTPVGGEEALNAGRRGLSSAVEKVYQGILQKGGR